MNTVLPTAWEAEENCHSHEIMARQVPTSCLSCLHLCSLQNLEPVLHTVRTHCEAGAVDGHAGSYLNPICLPGREADMDGTEVLLLLQLCHLALALDNACSQH